MPCETSFSRVSAPLAAAGCKGSIVGAMVASRSSAGTGIKGVGGVASACGKREMLPCGLANPKVSERTADDNESVADGRVPGSAVSKRSRRQGVRLWCAEFMGEIKWLIFQKMRFQGKVRNGWLCFLVLSALSQVIFITTP